MPSLLYLQYCGFKDRVIVPGGLFRESNDGRNRAAVSEFDSQNTRCQTLPLTAWLFAVWGRPKVYLDAIVVQVSSVRDHCTVRKSSFKGEYRVVSHVCAVNENVVEFES